MSKKERLILFLLATVNFTHILDFVIMMPLGNYLMPHFDISPKEFSLLVASYPISACCSGILISLFADQFDRKRLLLFTYAGFIIGTAACGFASSYNFLLCSRIVAGIFGGILGGQIFSMISDLFSYERRGAAMGAVMSSFAIASSVGVTFSWYLVDIFNKDWHLPFLFVSVVALIVLPLCIKHLPEIKEHLKNGNPEKKLKQLRSTVTDKTSGLALLFSGIVMMGHFLIIPFINQYMEFNKGYSTSVIPLVYLVGGIASFAAAMSLGRLSDRVGKLTVFSYCVPLSFIMVIVLTDLPPLPFSVVLAFFAIWFILATGRAITSQTMVTNVVDADKRGSFMSLNSSVQHLGSGAAALVAGYIIKEGKGGKLIHYEWVGYLSVFVLLIGLFLGRYLFRGSESKKSAGT